MPAAIRTAAFTLLEAGSLCFFLWTSWFLAHLITGAA